MSMEIRNELLKHDGPDHGYDVDTLFSLLWQAHEVKYLGDGVVQFNTPEEKARLKQIEKEIWEPDNKE